MYNNYGENQSNLKFLFVFPMKKYQGNGACCCSLWQMVIRRDSRVSTVPMPATPTQPQVCQQLPARKVPNEPPVK